MNHEHPKNQAIPGFNPLASVLDRKTKLESEIAKITPPLLPLPQRVDKAENPILYRIEKNKRKKKAKP